MTGPAGTHTDRYCLIHPLKSLMRVLLTSDCRPLGCVTCPGVPPAALVHLARTADLQTHVRVCTDKHGQQTQTRRQWLRMECMYAAMTHN